MLDISGVLGMPARLVPHYGPMPFLLVTLPMHRLRIRRSLDGLHQLSNWLLLDPGPGLRCHSLPYLQGSYLLLLNMQLLTMLNL